MTRRERKGELRLLSLSPCYTQMNVNFIFIAVSSSTEGNFYFVYFYSIACAGLRGEGGGAIDTLKLFAGIYI